jgi:N4-(beta-N-acetylglucosaminyl)-L-asparaginase
MRWSRRDFLGTGIAGLGAAAAAPLVHAAATGTDARKAAAPTADGKFAPTASPIVLCSRGERWARPVNAAAWAVLGAGGAALDAVVAGAQVVELDPEDESVGLGGLPNEDGVVQLDASVMSGKLKKCGAVGALERIATPSAVAKLVLLRTNHVMLVGDGALRFARAHGFEEQNLLTEKSRLKWLEWKEKLSPADDWLPPADGLYRDRQGRPTGTINVLAVDAHGDLAGCTSTSGLAYKIAGRLGDSPIVGAGLYVDYEIGAAGAVGRGEEVIKTCGSFAVVEAMRRGLEPEAACVEALQRIVRWTQELPDFNVQFVALRHDGAAGCAALWGTADAPPEAAVQTSAGLRILRGKYMFDKSTAKKS